MKKLFLLLLLGSLLDLSPAGAQPVQNWQRTYRKRQPDHYFGNGFGFRISATRYVLAGGLTVPDPISSSGLRANNGLLFIKPNGDSIGSVVHVIRGLNPSYPATTLLTVCRTPSGGIAAVGYMLDSLDYYSNFFYTCDTLGNRLTPLRPFNVHYNGSGANTNIMPLPDGYLVMVPRTALPAHVSGTYHRIGTVFKLDLQGNVVWQRIFPEQDLYLNEILPRPDGSYALVGHRYFYRGPGQRNPNHVWVGGITATGDTLPGRLYPTLRGSDDTYANAARLTPDGGLLLAGYTRGQNLATGSNLFYQGLLVKLDAQGTVQATRAVVAPAPGASYSDTGCQLYRLSVLANGDALAHGYYSRSANTADSFLGGFTGPALQPSYQQFDANIFNFPTLLHEPDGRLLVQGRYFAPTRDNGGTVVRAYQNAGLPYLPTLCATPPVPNAGYAFNAARDTLRLVDFSGGGPQYAVVSTWRWTFGDGSSYDGRTPPPHRYAPGTGAATAVTLTITNNLGCAATQVLYPFALGTAAARALAARLRVFPNPAAPGGAVTVQWPGLPAGPAPVAGELLDGVGRVVRRGRWAAAALAQGAALDVGGLSAGLYVLRLQAAEATATRRLELR